MKRIILIVCFLVTSLSLGAQKVWTLEESIQQCLQNNPRISEKGYQTEIRRTEIKAAQAKAFIPSISTNGTHANNYGRSIDPTTNQFVDQEIMINQFSATANYTIFDGFQSINLIKQNKYNYLSVEQELEKLKQDLALEVSFQFYKILYQEEMVQYAMQQVKVSEQKIEIEQLKVELGRSSTSDVLALKVQLSNDRMNLVNMRNELSIAKMKFNTLLGEKQDEDLQLKKPLDKINHIPESPEYILATNDDPAIQAAIYRTEAAKYGLSVARGSFYPTISIFGAIRTNYSSNFRNFQGYQQNGFTTSGYLSTDNTPVMSPNYTPVFQEVGYWDQIDQNLNKAVGVTLTFNILNGFQNYYNQKVAKLQYLSAKEQLEITRNETNTILLQTYNDYIAAKEFYNQAFITLQQSQEQFEIIEDKYNRNASNVLDYVETKNKLFKANADYIRSDYELRYKKAAYQILANVSEINN